MECISTLVKSSIPNYLANLPVPNSFGGWFRLSVKDWASLVPFFVFIGGVSYASYRLIKPKQVVNPDINKNEDKVVHIANIEDLGDKTSFCRCWRSAKFPYCDGAHSKHNRETGDNVGPVVVKRN